MNFTYGQTSQSSVTIGSWTSPALYNTSGRMIEATTTANGGTQTALVYNYDKMGRVEDLWQCAPYNCGSSSIWHMAYGWDLAGDMMNYTNPAGFTVTRTIDSAQQVTSQTYGTNMAVSNITYEPWGAISTMCGGQGCTQSQETRLYNSRLQPVLMELGNSTNLSADYCLVYNYYSSQGTPSSCSTPSQGTGDNGDILGMFRQDSANSSYGHAFTFTYDGVNRLWTAVATGSPAYNLTYNYDQYGNGWCVGGSGGGVCAALNYNSGKNQLTSIGGAAPVTINYDAAGNQLNDQYESYQYDAEGRVKLSSNLASPLSQCPTTTTTGPWQCPVYNALGQRVEDDQSDGQGRPMQLYYPRDIFGDRTGIWDDHSIAGWVGWDIYWSKVAGQRLNMGGSSAYIDHADAVGSTTMETDPAGGWQWDIVYFPWGQIWQQTGTRQSAVWGDLDWQVNDPLHPSATREYSGNVNRWMTPDPGGRSVVKLDNPQTWNMYAYVGNNPTTLNDPAGLQPDSPFTFVPNNYCYGFSCVKRFGSTGESTGVTVQGDDIFDALEGSPGTYLNFNQSGNLNFGFSEDLWIHDWSKSEEQFTSSPAYKQGIKGQQQTVTTNLEKVFPVETTGAHVRSDSPLYVAGGHANFLIDCGSANGGDCRGRWAGGLHIEGDPKVGLFWGHNDTVSYYIGQSFNQETFSLWNLVVHGAVDVVNGHLGNYIFPY